MPQHLCGLKAMENLKKINKNKNELSDEMMIFIILNTASIQIIPTTVIALRASLGSNNPTEIIIPVWISTIVADFVGICVMKIYLLLRKRRKIEIN